VLLVEADRGTFRVRLTLASPEPGAAAKALRSMSGRLEQLEPILRAVKERLVAASPERFTVEFRSRHHLSRCGHAHLRSAAQLGITQPAPNEISRPRASVDAQLRIPPTADEIEQLFAGWREELVTREPTHFRRFTCQEAVSSHRNRFSPAEPTGNVSGRNCHRPQQRQPVLRAVVLAVVSGLVSGFLDHGARYLRTRAELRPTDLPAWAGDSVRS